VAASHLDAHPIGCPLIAVFGASGRTPHALGAVRVVEEDWTDWHMAGKGLGGGGLRKLPLPHPESAPHRHPPCIRGSLAGWLRGLSRLVDRCLFTRSACNMFGRSIVLPCGGRHPKVDGCPIPRLGAPLSGPRTSARLDMLAQPHCWDQNGCHRIGLSMAGRAVPLSASPQMAARDDKLPGP
jgi:hypothetical protein